MEMLPWFQKPVLASSFEVLPQGQFPKAGVGAVVEVTGRCEKGRRLCSFIEWWAEQSGASGVCFPASGEGTPLRSVSGSFKLSLQPGH